jgi:tetratricopeptide (TPR) repeat protein
LRSAARAAARRQDWAAAARNYEALLATRRARAGDLIQLGHARKEMGDSDAALRAYAEAARRHPLHVDAQRQYGLYLHRLGREAEALDALARTLALEPDASEVRAEIATMAVTDAAALDRHFLRGIGAGCDALVGRRRGFSARFRGAGALGAARRRARARDWAGAEARYRAVLHYEPGRANARVQLGHALLEQDRAEDALACYRRAQVSSPREPELYLHVGHALKRLDRRDSALEAYLTAWRLMPGSPTAFEEIRGLLPNVEKADLLAGGGAFGTEAGTTAEMRLPDATRRSLIAPPPGLSHKQEAVFKLLSGAISYKE